MRLLACVCPAILLLLACGNDSEVPPMVGEGGGIDNDRAELLYAKAQEAEAKGNKKKAIKIYDELADEIPLARKAADSRYRQAQLLEEQGEVVKSFEAYQDFLTRYQGSGLYNEALNRQANMAFGAADGKIRNSFLGLRSDYSKRKVVGMLEKVARNAPRSELAARSWYKIAELHAGDGTINDYREGDQQKPGAVSCFNRVVVNYPGSKEAPEAQFRIGEILLEEAREGNQDQANLYRAREAFQDYLDQYPGHYRNAEARKLMATLGDRDVQRSFEIAEFYEKKGEYSSARFYYQEVVRKTKSGELHDKAQARLGALGQ